VNLRRLGLWLMLVVVLGWTLAGRLQHPNFSRAHDSGPRLQQRVYPLAFRYAAEIKAKIRESHSHSIPAVDDAQADVRGAVVDRIIDEPPQALSGTDLRVQFMSLQL
jgi:hypothetical protein